MEKKLKLMRFWLFGIFVLFFAMETALVYRVAGGNIVLAVGQSSLWLLWLLTAVLCVLVYYLYKWILGRQKK